MARDDPRVLSPRSLAVVAAAWILGAVLLLSAVGLTRVLGSCTFHDRAALVEILHLDTLAASPSGTPGRLPGGANNAVVPVQVPGLRAWLAAPPGAGR